MPTVLRSGPYRLFFYSADQNEPPHVHVERDTSRATFWLNPIRLAESGGFRRAEIGRIEKLVAENAASLVRAWDDFFGN